LKQHCGPEQHYQRPILAPNGRRLEPSSSISPDISILVNGGHRALSDVPEQNLLLSAILLEKQSMGYMTAEPEEEEFHSGVMLRQERNECRYA
jgi:hypothetical protein